MDNMKNLYNRWLKKATEDPDLISELEGIQGQDAETSDRFYQDLAFGTGGGSGASSAREPTA